MQNSDIKCKRTVTAVMRTMLVVALFTAVLLFAGKTSYAEGETVLTVQKDGVTVKEFTLDDLQSIAAEEGNKSYSYSAWNVYPTFSTESGISGATVRGILEAAGVYDSLKDTGTVTFYSDDDPVHYVDSYHMSLTGSQLREDRFYYPNGGLTDHAAGIIPEDAYDGAEPVPAVIETNNTFRLLVGQTEPNEENNPLFVKYMAKGGLIVVSDETAPRCDRVEVSLPNMSLADEGDELAISNVSGSSNTDYDKICFTFDSSISPGYGCPIYNCGPKSDLVCKPVLSGSGKVTLKVRVKGYGKLDSTLQTFTYYIGNALTVTVDGETAGTYHRVEDLEQAGTAVTCDYSGYSSYPTWELKENKTGIEVRNIIKDAAGKDPAEFDGRSTIRFTGVDGYSAVFTFDQLFGTERYCFPDGTNGTDSRGGKAAESAYEGSRPVPAIIETGGRNSLYFGQAAPNEQNFPECVNNMLKLGVISIDTSPAGQCEAVASADPVSGSAVEPGTGIAFPFPTEEHKRDKLYYIIDPEEGQIPGYGDAFFYYSANLYPQQLTNPPVLSQPGHHIISTRVFAYGKQDSEVRVFEYDVNPSEPPVPAIDETGNRTPESAVSDIPGTTSIKLSAGSKKIKVRWSRVSGASGYVVMRSTKKNSGFKTVKTIKKGSTVSFTNKKLKKGKKYYYKVRAYKKVNGIKIYGAYSAVKAAEAK